MPHLWDSVRGKIKPDLWYLIPGITFVFMTLMPNEALAFAEYVDISQQPLVFVRDATLADKAIVGIDIFSRRVTAGEVLNSRSSRISFAPSDIRPGMAIRVITTGYSSTADQTDASPFTTASGTTVHNGTLAANFLPFGTKVRIGDTLYTVEDRMNARYNNTLIVDIWYSTRDEAWQHGVQVQPIEVVSIPGVQ